MLRHSWPVTASTPGRLRTGSATSRSRIPRATRRWARRDSRIFWR